jgi:peptide/nickel transport system permease protein
MFSYLARRLLLAALMLVLVTLCIYALVRSMPGDPAAAAIGDDPSIRLSDEQWEAVRKLYGLDKPWYQAYFVWIGNVLRGDLGHSLSQRQSVTSVIGERIGPTLLLSVSSLVLVYGLSIPLGLWTASRSGRTEERLATGALYALYSLPVFVAGLFLQLLFAVKLGWLPLVGMTSENYDQLSLWGKTWDIFRHALLPVACYTYGGLAYLTRFIHANLQDVLRQDYIRTARAKGVPPRRVLTQHAFRNTLIPLVTLLGISLPGLLSGSVLVEQIFNWPGMGRLFFEAIRARDYEVIMGLALVFSVLTLAGQLLADLLYAWVDPRVGRG